MASFDGSSESNKPPPFAEIDRGLLSIPQGLFIIIIIIIIIIIVTIIISIFFQKR